MVHHVQRNYLARSLRRKRYNLLSPASIREVSHEYALTRQHASASIYQRPEEPTTVIASLSYLDLELDPFVDVHHRSSFPNYLLTGG